MKKIWLVLLLTFLSTNSFTQDIAERFEGNDKVAYQVFYNGIFSGNIYWSYQGKGMVGQSEVDILRVSSDTKIFNLLDLTSDEEVFLDSKTHLPLKVRRDVVFFGKNELIDEIYNQKKGYVQLIVKGDESRQEIIRQTPPIHNILALLYFFPKNVILEPDEWMDFNLPKHTVKIKFIKERPLKVDGQEVATYFLIGRGAKRFSLWMDKTTRMPLRLEFVSVLGKISIIRIAED